MVLNKIVNINVQRENGVLFSEQNYFLYRAYTINKYSRFNKIKTKQTKHHSLASIYMKMLRNSQNSNLTKQNFFLNSCLGYGSGL